MKMLALVLRMMKTKRDGRRTKAEMAMGLLVRLGNCLEITGSVQRHGKRRARTTPWLGGVPGTIDGDNPWVTV